jgi:hypothetical protein
VNPRAFEPDLDGLPSVDVADYPTRFKHNPPIGLRSVVRAALGDLHAVNEDKNVTVFIPLNLANRFVMVHGYPTVWVRLAFPRQTRRKARDSFSGASATQRADSAIVVVNRGAANPPQAEIDENNVSVIVIAALSRAVQPMCGSRQCHRGVPICSRPRVPI